MNAWPAEVLSPPEMEALTGYVQRAAQRRWLESHRVPYIERRDGFPIVRRDQLQPAASAVIVNVEALRARRKAA